MESTDEEPSRLGAGRLGVASFAEEPDDPMHGVAAVAKKVPSALAAALRCPACRSELVPSPGSLACADCAIRFPIVDGVPVLIDDAASVFSRNDFVAHKPTTIHPESRLWRLASWLVPYATSNRAVTDNLEELWRRCAVRTPSPRILVIGSGEPGATHERLLSKPGAVVVETDVSIAGRTAVVCDAHQLPFASGTFDAVVIQAVLDDVVDPYRCVDEIHRVLAKGGVVYAETPFLQAVHDGRYDFTRFTHLGHRRLFRRFEEIRSGSVGGPAIAIARLYQVFLRSFFRSRSTRAGAVLFARMTGFWLKYAELWFIDDKNSLDAAYGCYFLGTRSERTLDDRELVMAYRGAVQRS